MLSDYIKIPSITRNEGEAGRFLSKVCRDKGLYLRIFTDKDSNYNFAASIYPLQSKKPNIIFLNHIDVVPPGHLEAWLHPPFGGDIADSMVWGRGAIDCKGLAIMQLMAITDFIEIARLQNLPYNVTFLAVSGEELAGFNGSKQLSEYFMEELSPIAVFGEGGSGLTNVIPSNPEARVFGVSLAEKSNLWLQLELQFNSSGHGAAPPAEYVNQVMLKALGHLSNRETKYDFSPLTRSMFRELGRLEGGVKGFVLKNANWWLFRSPIKKHFTQEPMFQSLVTNTILLTNFKNPDGPVNQISDQATVLLDCRLLPGTNRKRFIKQIQAQLMEPRIKISVIDEGVDAQPSENGKFFRALENAIKENYKNSSVVPILFPATTDNSYFRSKGVQVYGLIPSILSMDLIESVHNINERISIESLNRGIDTYKSLLDNLILNKESRKWYRRVK